MLHRSATAALLCSTTLLAVARGQEDAAAKLLAAIRTHLDAVGAESARYDKIVFFGETVSDTALAKDVLQRERDLFRDAVAAKLFDKPVREATWLGHNMIVHDLDAAAPFLAALRASVEAGNRALDRDLFNAIMAAGEAGERMVVAGLGAARVEQRRGWAAFLSKQALHGSSVAPIEKQLATERDAQVRAFLVSALGMIGIPSSLPMLRKLAETAADDEEQASAMFACVDLQGFEAIPWLEKLEPKGPHAKREREQGLEYLRTETSAVDKHGHEVHSDAEFVARFGDLHGCPTIAWLGEQKLLEGETVTEPTKLDAAQKKRLFELLLDSKGFGLEAVKGALFLSLAKADEPVLLRLRAEGYWSPNPLAPGRAHTLGIMVRHIRQEL